MRFAALFIHGLQFTLCEAVTTLSYDLLCLAAASCNKCYFFCTSQFCYGTTVFVGQRVCGIMTPRGLLVLVDLYIAEERFCTRPHLFIKVVREGIHPSTSSSAFHEPCFKQGHQSQAPSKSTECSVPDTV